MFTHMAGDGPAIGVVTAARAIAKKYGDRFPLVEIRDSVGLRRSWGQQAECGDGEQG